jgi:hypothetical protein
MKNKRIHPLFRISWAVIAGSLLLSACSKSFLDVNPPGQQKSEQFWQTQDDATKAVNAIYANLRSWPIVAFAPIAVESMGSDDVVKGSTPGDATFMNDYDHFTNTSTEGQVKDFWTGQYQEINLCNQVLDHVDTMHFDEGLKARYIAEAKFVRGYCYFRLVRAFGGVPLRLHLPAGSNDYNLPRSSEDSVWMAIEQDLSDAASVLPQSYGPADIGRATKGAALAMHAKVAMYQKKWQDVLDLTNQVMTMGYSLFPDFEQMFRIANENCSESIFEIQAQYVAGNNDISNSQYSQVQGDRDVTTPGSVGWGFNVPTQDLVDAFESGDPRMDATILFAGETTPEGDVVPDATAGSPTMYNQKSYVPFALAATDNQGSDQNIRVLRYAEVLLMNAEAANELGLTSQALSSLNQLRETRREGNAGVLPDVTTTDQNELRLAIWHERRVELALEFDRFFDVIRQGRAGEIFGPLGFTVGKNEHMPIPQDEIDLSGGTLVQNPGY